MKHVLSPVRIMLLIPDLLFYYFDYLYHSQLYRTKTLTIGEKNDIFQQLEMYSTSLWLRFKLNMLLRYQMIPRFRTKRDGLQLDKSMFYAYCNTYT